MYAINLALPYALAQLFLSCRQRSYSHYQNKLKLLISVILVANVAMMTLLKTLYTQAIIGFCVIFFLSIISYFLSQLALILPTEI